MDPSSGRFITPDPVRDFYNPYSYVHNNPMNRIDPTGMYSPPTQQYGSITGYEFRNRTDPLAWLLGGLSALTTKSTREEERALYYLRMAENEANYMASSSDNEQEKQDWSAIANELHKIIATNNFVVMNGLCDKDGNRLYAKWSGVFDGETGNFKTGTLLIDRDLLFNDNPSGFITGILIHEAAHVVHDKKSNLFNFRKSGKETIFTIVERYTYASEKFANRFELMHTAKTMNIVEREKYRSNTTLQNDYYKHYFNIGSMGFESALDNLLQLRYEELYNNYGP